MSYIFKVPDKDTLKEIRDKLDYKTHEEQVDAILFMLVNSTYNTETEEFEISDEADEWVQEKISTQGLASVLHEVTGIYAEKMVDLIKRKKENK